MDFYKTGKKPAGKPLQNTSCDAGSFVERTETSNGCSRGNFFQQGARKQQLPDQASAFGHSPACSRKFEQMQDTKEKMKGTGKMKMKMKMKKMGGVDSMKRTSQMPFLDHFSDFRQQNVPVALV